MRVPIENGLGFINQVSDFIKLPATYRDCVYNNLTYFKFTRNGFFIAAKNPVYISAFA